MKATRRLLMAILLLLTSGLANHAEANETMDYTLDNGLKVILIENHRAPVVSMLVWVKTGSADEREGEHGLAHLMEHMLFKGTARRGPGDIAAEVEASGGYINAYTSMDQTVYYIDMASRFAGRGLDVLADMTANPRLDETELAREKEVVIEEINRSEDMPTRRLSNKLFGQAFTEHPYGRPIIGFTETVRAVTPGAARGFHQRNYRPANMILVVAGDFDPAGLKPEVDRLFGAMPPGQAERRARPQEPAQTAPRAFTMAADVGEARLDLAFHIPRAAEPETRALDIAAVVLGQGRTSRLYRRLVREKQLVSQAWAEAYTPLDPGLFIVGLAMAPEKTLPAAQEALEVIAGFAKTGPSRQELERARLKIKADFVKSRAAMSGEARLAASFQAIYGDFRERERYLAALDQVTAEEVAQAAARFLKPENLTLGALLPQAQEQAVTEKALVSLARRSGQAQAAPAVVRRQLPGGGLLLIKPDHSLPLVSLRAAFLGGVRFETEETNGVNKLLSEIWDKGTEELSAAELAAQVEDIAGSLSSFSGRNTLGLEAEFLSQHLDEGLALFAQVLTRPRLAASELERARAILLSQLKREEEQLFLRTFQLFSQTIYPTHPYRFRTLGTQQNLASIPLETVQGFYQNYAVPGNMVLAIVGDVDPQAVASRLERLLEGWTGRDFTPPQVPPPAPVEEPRAAELSLERAQAHLVLGFLAPGLESQDRYALEVLDKVLSGMGGRLFTQLRDKQSLAYTVSALYRPGLGAGVFGFYIGFGPEKYEEVKAALMDQLMAVRGREVSPEELAAAKESILGGFEIGLQQPSAQAADLAFNELFGLGYDYAARYVEAISQVTAGQVLAVAKKYLDPAHAVTAVVGEAPAWVLEN